VALAGAALVVVAVMMTTGRSASDVPASVGSSTIQLNSDVVLRSKLANISNGRDAAESKLEAGAAAFAGSFFDPTTPSPEISEALAAAAGELPIEGGGGSAPEGAVHGKGWYRVNIKTIVRSGKALDSPQVTIVSAGLFVHVDKEEGRRVHVDRAATSLENSQLVNGWMSMRSSDDRIQILRPSRQAELPWPTSANTLEVQARREHLEEEAQKVAKITASQKKLNDQLSSVNVKGLAHDLVHFSRHQKEYEAKGAREVQKAGDHMAKTVANGANQLLGSLDGLADGVTGHETDHAGARVSDMDLKLPPGLGQALIGALKKGF